MARMPGRPVPVALAHLPVMRCGWTTSRSLSPTGSHPTVGERKEMSVEGSSRSTLQLARALARVQANLLCPLTHACNAGCPAGGGAGRCAAAGAAGGWQCRRRRRRRCGAPRRCKRHPPCGRFLPMLAMSARCRHARRVLCRLLRPLPAAFLPLPLTGCDGLHVAPEMRPSGAPTAGPPPVSPPPNPCTPHRHHTSTASLRAPRGLAAARAPGPAGEACAEHTVHAPIPPCNAVPARWDSTAPPRNRQLRQARVPIHPSDLSPPAPTPASLRPPPLLQVLMHGILGSRKGLDQVVAWIEAAFPGLYVRCVPAPHAALPPRSSLTSLLPPPLPSPAPPRPSPCPATWRLAMVSRRLTRSRFR